MIHSFNGITPKLHESVFMVQSAEIIGDVEIGANSSVWYNVVVRGDVNYIRIGAKTNVQDGCLLHVRSKKYPLLIGNGITLGHGVIAHACTIEDYCLIGMGAVILDNATIGARSLVAAGAVVKMNEKVPSGVLVAGVPAKVVRDLTDDENRMLEESAENYVQYVQMYRQSHV